MTTFAPSAISSLIDAPVRYDLAESTSPSLRLADVVDPAVLADLSLDYGTSRGDLELRELIAADSGVEPDQVLVTVGAIEALFLLAQDRSGPDARAVVAAPYFPPTRTVPDGLGLRIDELRLRFDDGYRLPLGDLAGVLTPQTRLVSLASPQNPSGVRFTDDELSALVAEVERRSPDAVVLVDETYRAASYGDTPVPASAATLSPRVVTCSSLSKAHGTPGLRIGWLTTTDAELYERLRNAKFLTTVACSAPDELLATHVLRQAKDILGARSARLQAALDELTAWVEGQPVELVRPDAGALCCLRLPAGTDVPAFHRRLAALDARVAPGSWFGEDDRIFRLGFGHLEPGTFTEALSRLAQALPG
jgi:aspartate/methionine/tyrosine aminotransferase